MFVFQSLIYYLIGYFMVTTLASLHFLFNWKVMGYEGFDTRLGIHALKANATQFDAFKRTKPFHPLYNISVFPLVSVYMLTQLPYTPSLLQAFVLGTIWLVYSLVFDWIFWLLVPHPWRLTTQELFLDYQPWITFAYLAIFISPLLGTFYFLG